jgi:hypothetical protein
MDSESDNRHREASKAPKSLVPTGSVDEVLFTGLAGGKSLTLFQSLGLMIIGIAVAIGVGALIIAGELHLEATFDRDFGQLFVGGALVLWGLTMLVFGSVGVVKIVWKRRRT